ncbi:MAG: hypothetical protein AVDCRST_MAG29-161, partial [uncultured Nocardioidaceae bacterium]
DHSRGDQQHRSPSAHWPRSLGRRRDRTVQRGHRGEAAHTAAPAAHPRRHGR